MFSMVFLRFYASLIKDLKKNIIFVFHALYSINYVKSVGFTNLFLLQYRVPPKSRKVKEFPSFLIKYNIISAEKASLSSSFEFLDVREK